MLEMLRNKSRYAILGILSLGPKSGYDIKKWVEESISNFWGESYGQIYPILKSLVAENLATRSIKSQKGKPDRHVYAITRKGRGELQRWLVEPIPYKVERVEILLKLFFGRQVSKEHCIKHVENFINLQKKLFEKYRTIESYLKTHAHQEPDFPYWVMTLSYGKHVNQALLQWSKETLATLRKSKNGKQTKG